MTSKCDENKKVAHEAQPTVSLMFLPHFDVLCDLLGSFRFEDEDEHEDKDEALCFRHNEIFKIFRLQLGRDDEVDCNNIVTPSLSRI